MTRIEEAVAELAASYDPALVESTLRRLRRLQAGSGKTCSACEETKPLSAFWLDSTRADGLFPQCKACCSARRRVNANTPGPLL